MVTIINKTVARNAVSGVFLDTIDPRIGIGRRIENGPCMEKVDCLLLRPLARQQVTDMFGWIMANLNIPQR